MRAYGTVKLSPWNDGTCCRLDSGRPILAPLKAGDVVQTGEDSAAELLFFGGNTMQLQSGTIARFDEDEESVTIRLVMGRAFMMLPQELIAGKKPVFRKGDGTYGQAAEGKHFVLSVGSVETFDEGGVNVQEVDVNESPDEFASVELRLLAHGEEEASRFVPIVPPIEHRPDLFPAKGGKAMRMEVLPKPSFPENEGDIDVEVQNGVAFEWRPVPFKGSDPVVGYEVMVRPAPGYIAEDSARKNRAFKTSKTRYAMEKIDGAGVFLWSVRPVLDSGERGPASAPRWLEIKFPKRLKAPEVMAPKIE